MSIACQPGAAAIAACVAESCFSTIAVVAVRLAAVKASRVVVVADMPDCHMKPRIWMTLDGALEMPAAIRIPAGTPDLRRCPARFSDPAALTLGRVVQRRGCVGVSASIMSCSTTTTTLVNQLHRSLPTMFVSSSTLSGVSAGELIQAHGVLPDHRLQVDPVHPVAVTDEQLQRSTSALRSQLPVPEKCIQIAVAGRRGVHPDRSCPAT